MSLLPDSAEIIYPFDQKPNGKASAGIESRVASSFKQRRVNWLWENRLALGKITLIGGYPGVGKTQLVIDCIARMTSGGRWPSGELASTGDAIILSSEDDAADTICPRLEAAGAMLDGVVILGCAVDGEGKPHV